MADNNKPLTEQESTAWSQQTYQKATAFLAEKGIITATVSMEHSRYLAPLVAIWKIKTSDSQWLWVISGDLPTDFVAQGAAKTARDAMKSFSFKWQMDSEKIKTAGEIGADQMEFAKLLQTRAESLYDICEQDDLWPPTK